ncbi:hypothetical protein A33Q_1514 [Indibacter alkaliphilus LW1]|uniref:Uncharacterized protein n=1 Tax=Indibacter alkaliphilus (strain CCUG 57479 / KCTC 22604 / LW1) TaxID=1189612 RepID=S2DFX5_INDAL|nr:hypothetical protein A33Q_1514 [Indibacter alkaliphilus LW1]
MAMLKMKRSRICFIVVVFRILISLKISGKTNSGLIKGWLVLMDGDKINGFWCENSKYRLKGH